MKTLKLVTLLAMTFLFSLSSAQLSVGDKAPDFKLVNTDGSNVALSDYNDEKGIILIFNCNHCPYAKLYEQRIIDLHRKYRPLKFPVVSVNPNDSSVYKEDGFSYMVAKNYEFPYLLDNTGVYKKYGATKTPHVFLLQRRENTFKVAYIGAIDDNPQNPNEVKDRYLENAIEAISNNEEPKPSITKAIGCSIKPFK